MRSPFVKSDVQVERRDEHGLRDRALQVHLHARAAAVPQRDVTEGIEIEVRLQFAVQPRQNVLVEGRRDSLRVVVRGNENLRTLGEVGAQQQRVARAQRAAYAAQQADGIVGLEVADTGADVEHQLAARYAVQRFDACRCSRQ